MNPRRVIPLRWHPWSQPRIGSLRAFVEESDARLGDWLVIVFDRSGAADVRSVSQQPGRRDLLHIAKLVGLETDGPLTALAELLGIDLDDSRALGVRVRDALEARGDVELVRLIDEID